MNSLRHAMDSADIAELEAVAAEIGREAVAMVTSQQSRLAEEEQRQRDLDGALADAVEVVARQRSRLGRRACSRHDGETIRRVFELLRGLMADCSDSSWQ